MSRAFTKEDDAGEDLPERPVPSGPNYVTPRGLALLKEAGEKLLARKKAAKEGDDLRPINRDLRYLEARVNSAIVVPLGSGTEIRFGATVTIEDEAGQRQTFKIVGMDEAWSDEGFLSWSSPLAVALFGAKPGEQVTWESDDAPKRIKVVAVEYSE